MLTQKRLKELFYYEPTTGIFTRRVARGPCAAGYVVGSRSTRTESEPYIQVEVDGRQYGAHRLAWLYCYGYLPESLVDHRDRNPSNNALLNLREASHSCNTRNAKISCTNTSGVKGVSWYKDRDKWQACLHIKGKNCILGYHKCFLEAVCHRLAAEQAENWEGCDSSSPAFLYLQKELNKSKEE